MNTPIILMMMTTCLLGSASCSSRGEEPFEPVVPENVQSSVIEQTTPIPEEYFSQASQRGRIERIEYQSKDYTGSMQPTLKPAYVYLPYGYDPAQKYDIIYLIHGWGGSAEVNFQVADGRLINIFDNLIQKGKTKPFIAVSPTWDKDNRGKSWSESVAEVAVFHNEYKNDLIPAVEGKYSTYAQTTDEAGIVASRNHRAFGGFSLGSITTWYQFENGLNLQKWFLPMSGDSWLAGMFGGQSQPEKTAQNLANLVNASPYKGNGFYVWYAVGTEDSRFYQTHNQALAMTKLTETFNTNNFSYHQKQGGRHDYNAVFEFIYHALPFFFPKN